MLTERIDGVLTRWDLPEGQRVPFKGEPFQVLRDVYDATGPEPVRTIKAIRIGRSLDTDHSQGMD